MHWRAAVVLAGLLWSAGAAAGLSDELDGCIAGLFAGRAQVERDSEVVLAEVCPGLTASLKTPALADLDPPLGPHTSLAQLLDARLALRSRHAAPASGPRLDLAGLPALLEATLEPAPAAPPPGWWARFKAWLKQWFKAENDANTESWLRWLETIQIPTWLAELMLKGAVLTLLVLALVVVFNEVRAAGLRGWRWRLSGMTRRAFGHGRDAAAPAAPSWEAIGRLPLQHQPAALLRHAIAVLVARGIVADDDSRTNREYLHAVTRQAAPAAAAFEPLVDSAERTVYGGQAVSAVEAQQLRSAAQRLAHALEAGA